MGAPLGAPPIVFGMRTVRLAKSKKVQSIFGFKALVWRVIEQCP
jgi:hypothetical protein